MHVRYRTQEGINYGTLSSTYIIPLHFERILTVSKNSNGQFIENIEYSCCKIYPLIRKNVAIILRYYIQHFIGSNYSMQEIQNLIMLYFPAKDGILHVKKYQNVRLFSDYQYEFDSIIIENKGELTVETYNPIQDMDLVFLHGAE